ncbi:MAG TPA: hypothetical protein VGE66_19270 [Chitinophagaceae bacterium]
MPDLLTIISRWWKTILAITLGVTAVALVILLLQPKQYLSVVTALPAPGFASDKARIFSDNIEQLYPTIGTADELDPVVGTGKLDTLYLAVAAEHNLASYYGMENASPLKVAQVFKHNSKVEKSEYGELKVKVWDRKPAMAATLANSLFNKLQQLHQSLQSQGNALVLQRLQEQYRLLQKAYSGAPDSARQQPGGAELASLRRKNLLEQISQYEKLIAEYSLVLHTNPQALLVVEMARPAVRADKPRILQVLLLTAFASLVFGLLLTAGLQSRKQYG